MVSSRKKIIKKIIKIKKIKLYNVKGKWNGIIKEK